MPHRLNVEPALAYEGINVSALEQQLADGRWSPIVTAFTIDDGAIVQIEVGHVQAPDVPVYTAP